LVVGLLVTVGVGFAGYRVYRRGFEARLKTQVLSREQHRPATPFKLVDLDGRAVALEDFRGKVLVLSFWATWCGPCQWELEDLKAAYAKYKNNPIVAFAAVSVDTDRSLVAPHTKKHGYPFPVLLSDGTVETPYDTASGIPKLYVVDGVGNIRFKVDGYNIVGDNVQTLGWMIEAARR
jgi:thiol-disulfide isomerase/thioredoxin